MTEQKFFGAQRGGKRDRMTEQTPDAPGGERAQDEPMMDFTQSFDARDWARALVYARRKLAEPEPPNQEATALEARIEFVRHQIQLALDGRYIDDIPTSLVRTLVLADGLFEEVLKGKK